MHDPIEDEDLGINLSPAEVEEFKSMDKTLRDNWDRTLSSPRRAGKTFSIQQWLDSKSDTPKTEG